MRARVGFVLMVALLCAAAAGLARPPAAHALDYRDYAVKERILLLQGYLNSYGAQHAFVYPTKSAVRAGGLTVTLWPTNPWTGKPMASGTHRGDFTYTPRANRHSYILVGHLSGGPFTVKGSTPSWLLSERAAQASALAAARDRETELGVRTIKGYIESRGMLTNGLAPLSVTAADLGVDPSIWPENPWTGAPMAERDNRGDFYYAPGANGAYLLTAHLNDHDVAIDGTELSQFHASLVAARDCESELGVRTIQGYIDAWGMLHDGVAPTSVSALDLGIDPSVWPMNPWNSSPMAVGSNAGNFSYSVGTSGVYALTAHLSDQDVVLDGTNLDQLRTSTNALRDDLVKANVQNLQAGVDRYSLMNRDALPLTLSSATVSSYYLPAWPKNPWMPAVDMQQGPGLGLGNFTYTLLNSGCSDQIASQLSDGSAFTADSTFAALQHDLRARLRDISMELSGQVIREYIEEWKAANGGVAPGVDQLTQSGAVGSAHGFWPVSPWTNIPVANSDTRGDFQYVPGTGGAYTLTVRLEPVGPFTEYYTPL